MKLTKSDLYDKIIDAHTHAGMSLSNFFDDKFPYCYSVLDISNNLACADSDVACVFPFPSYICGDNIALPSNSLESVRYLFEPIPYKNSIEKILTEIERFNLTNLLPFGMFSTNYAIDEQLIYLNSISDKIYGLKYYPDADAKSISTLSTDGKPFIDFLIQENLPLIIHVSENACLYKKGVSNVADAIDLAHKFPALRVCVAHMGHFSKNALERLLDSDLPNLFLDLSPLKHICHIRTINVADVLDLDYNSPANVLDSLIAMFPDKLVWGTDMPFNFTCNLSNDSHNFDFQSFSVKENAAILHGLAKEKKLKISNHNTLNLLFG